MIVLKRLSMMCFGRSGRPLIAATLAAVLVLMLIAPQPARAQLGSGAVLVAAQAVVDFINNTIGPLLTARV